jgi:hypothetical protein
LETPAAANLVKTPIMRPTAAGTDPGVINAQATRNKWNLHEISERDIRLQRVPKILEEYTQILMGMEVSVN